MSPQNETPGMEFFSHCAGRLMGVVRIPLLSCGDEHPESRMIASRVRNIIAKEGHIACEDTQLKL